MINGKKNSHYYRSNMFKIYIARRVLHYNNDSTYYDFVTIYNNMRNGRFIF